jgi:predicted RNA-binding Zn ribbon-like protein
MVEAHPTVALSRGPLKRVGGALALDFLNTTDWRLRDEPEEWLLSYGDLVAWTRGAGAIDALRARRLLGLAKTDPRAAERVLTDARRLREALFRIFSTIKPSARDLELVNSWLARTAPRSGLARDGRRLGWRWPEPERLETVLAPVLWSAGDLLTGDGRDRLKLCAADGCGWMFLDASRKANRLWCSMETCGNRAKAQRHYRRSRGTG